MTLIVFFVVLRCWLQSLQVDLCRSHSRLQKHCIHKYSQQGTAHGTPQRSPLASNSWGQPQTFSLPCNSWEKVLVLSSRNVPSIYIYTSIKHKNSTSNSQPTNIVCETVPDYDNASKWPLRCNSHRCRFLSLHDLELFGAGMSALCVSWRQPSLEGEAREVDPIKLQASWFHGTTF